MSIRQFIIIILIAFFTAGTSAAADKKIGDIPNAALRTNGQNYKDMMLAGCIARAYEKDIASYKDAGSTASALRDLTVFDVEESTAAINALVAQYLERDFHNPMEGFEGVQFKLLKCLDMYHSKALDAQVKKFVKRPNWIGNKPLPMKKEK